jgi:DNA-binding Lrp family transcriptional regulator
MLLSNIIRHLWVTESHLSCFERCLNRLKTIGMIECIYVYQDEDGMVCLTESSVDKVHSFIDGTLDKSDTLYDSIECIIKYSQSAHY